MSTKYVDVAFKITSGSPIKSDHRYYLFSAVSEVIPDFHNGGPFGLHVFVGRQDGNRTIRLNDESCLLIRTPSHLIGDVLSIGGSSLRIGTAVVLCSSVPEVRKLYPSVSLRSGLVTIKRKDKKTDDVSFVEAFRKQLATIGVSPSVQIELPSRLSRSGEERSARRTFSIKGREIIGYEVRLHGLSAEESIAVQSAGLGGRRAMGCGLFKPFRLLDQHPGLQQDLAEATTDA